jgi:hypothetical protein
MSFPRKRDGKVAAKRKMEKRDRTARRKQELARKRVSWRQNFGF